MNKKSKILISVGIIVSIILIGLCNNYNYSKNINKINAKIMANLPYDTDNFVYLSDIKWKSATSSWNDPRALKKDENESGDLISLIVNNEKTYFLKGVFAHAHSTVIYDLSSFNYDTFESYVGVDSSRNASGNGVKFYIYVGNNENDWTLRSQTEVLKGNMEAVKIKTDIKGFKYLKLVADYQNNQDSDHSVYADAKLYNSATYTPSVATKVDYIKEVEEYDKELDGIDVNEIINNSNLELKLLQRNLVKQVGYPILQALATADDYKKEGIDWLFNNKEILEIYTTGGEPLGNYVKSLTILSNLYHTYKDDLKNSKYTDIERNVFLKMMMAISLTHSGTVAFWTNGENNTQVLSDPLKRYEVYKNLYLHEGLPEGYEEITNTFNAQVFETLTVEEMRWVVDARLSDEELPWLNWYSSNLENTKYGDNGNRKSSMDPYTYIWYNDSFKWAYTDANYYVPGSTYCAPDIKTPGIEGYVRNTKCNDIYHTEEWGIKSDTNTQPRLWVVWEEDGVCGALSKTGENLHNSYGEVAAVTRQPGHAAYLVQTKTKNENGYNVTWSIRNDVHGWGKSSGTEKGERLPLNWGTTTLDYSSDYNASYVLLAQRAIDDFENYKQALNYKLIADIYENDPDKQEEIYRLIVGNPSSDRTLKNTNALEYFNLDGWYGLIKTYMRNENKTQDDYYYLAQEIIANLKEFPLPMHDLLKYMETNIGDYSIEIKNAEDKVLNELKGLSDNDPNYKQPQAVRQVATYLLGLQDKKPISFSFDGDNANKIILNTGTESKKEFEYSLDYSYDVSTEEVHATWIKATNSNSVDLTNKLDEITVDKDIVVHIIGDNDKTPTSPSITIINIEKSNTPTNLYANDLENKVIGVNDTMEWQISSKAKSNNWVKFSEEEPDVSHMTTLLVREGAHATYLPSDSVEFTFEEDPEADASKVYIPIKRLSATASTYEKDAESPMKAIDGHNQTIWHTKWNGSDTDKWISIHINGGAVVSKLDYVPRQDGSANGRITKARIETSLDGEHWTLIEDNIEWANDSLTKTYFFTNPIRANYVRLTGVETQGPGSYASASMINLYENTVNTRVDVNTLNISYMSSGYVYNGSEHTPSVTVKEGDSELILNEQYTVSYDNNVNAGTGNINITGVGIYNGTINKTFTISKAQSPVHEPIDYILAEPEETTLRDIKLPDGWDWEKPETVLKNGKTITAKAIYNDKNNYENYTKEITVVKMVGFAPTMEVTGHEIDYVHNKVTINLNYDDGEKDLEYFKNLITINDYEDGDIPIDSEKVTIKNELEWEVGTYHIYITVVDNDNNETTLDMEISIHKEGVTKDIKDYSVTILGEPFIYTGDKIETQIIIKDNDHTLTYGTNYIITYENNINAGVATMVIHGAGIYSGTITKNFVIKKVPVPANLPDAIVTVSEDTTSIGEITLPEGWNWASENTNLQLGRNVLTVIYLGDENHERYEFEIVVIRGEEVNTEPTPTPQPDDKPNMEDKTNDTTNKDKETEKTKPTVPTKTPDTGDKIMKYVGLGIGSIIILIVSIWLLKKYKK